MSRETERKHLDGAIAVATEALQHLQRGSVVGVKYHEGGSIDEVGGPALIMYKLEVEALDLPLRAGRSLPGDGEATETVQAAINSLRSASKEIDGIASLYDQQITRQAPASEVRQMDLLYAINGHLMLKYPHHPIDGAALTEVVMTALPSTIANKPPAIVLDETTIRSILMGVFLESTTMTIDRAVKKLLDAQALLK